MTHAIDPYFRVEVISKTLNPQQTIYAAMHQDYSEEFVFDELHEDKEVFSVKTCEPTGKLITEWSGASEEECGDIIVKRLLAGGRGHFGCLEHPQIVFNCGWFPHSVMQQVRTHRVGISFDVQSFRYTGKRLYDVGIGLTQQYVPGVWNHNSSVKSQIEEVVYLRPKGEYTDRQGDRYHYTEQSRLNDLTLAAHCLSHYARNIEKGYAEEHARGLIPFDVRQHFVMSVNVRSLMHLLDLRTKLDAQLECQQLCELIFPHFEKWVPEIASWYKENRLGKAKLSP